MAAHEKEVIVFVRIIATPPGEAPEEVRQAWLVWRVRKGTLRLLQRYPSAHVRVGLTTTRN